MSASVDREQLRRDLSDALERIQKTDDVAGLEALAAQLQTLEPPHPFHAGGILRALAPVPRQYSALIWHVLQAITKLEGR
jgi:hypothetical protein